MPTLESTRRFQLSVRPKSAHASDGAASTPSPPSSHPTHPWSGTRGRPSPWLAAQSAAATGRTGASPWRSGRTAPACRPHARPCTSRRRWEGGGARRGWRPRAEQAWPACEGGCDGVRQGGTALMELAAQGSRPHAQVSSAPAPNPNPTPGERVSSATGRSTPAASLPMAPGLALGRLHASQPTCFGALSGARPSMASRISAPSLSSMPAAAASPASVASWVSDASALIAAAVDSGAEWRAQWRQARVLPGASTLAWQLRSCAAAHIPCAAPVRPHRQQPLQPLAGVPGAVRPRGSSPSRP